MKKSVCSVLTKVGFAALVLSLNFFAACEIGLGSSVDVEAPKIDFADSTVDSGAVVRDAFAVFGSWEDDGSIGSINATLKNLETGAEVKKAGTIGDKQWSVAFSPADDSITDGTYELSIVIKDGADHESKISRSFIIDNTPPLVVLSRPSTKIGAASFDSYGQKFTLEGKAADDNDVSLIEVNVYADADCSGSPLKTISLPSVPLTIETDVAEYSKTEANDYSVIYGIVDDNGIAKRNGGTVDRFCKLVVYDGAQRYPADGSAQTEADKKGNSIDYYYLNSDLAELFTEGYKITELYHILNGTYAESNARTTSPDGVVTLLKSDTTKVTTGQFKLNPENSPHFVVSARSILEAGHTIDEAPLTNGNSKLEVEIAPGLDGHLIKEETIGIYLVRCDNYGNPLKEDGSAAADESEAKIIWLVETDKHEQQAEITQSGSTYKFKTKTEVGNANYPDLMIGENYYVAVVGKDMQGNNILCDGIYGFQLITSGLNIEVGIRSEPDWISTNANANDVNKTPKIILTYSTENKPFEILRGLDTANLVSIDTGVMTSPYQDNLNITSTGPLGFEPTIVVYKVNGENSAESNPKSIELRYDDTAPQVTISEKPDEIATEQKSITFRGTAADKNSNGEEESGVKTVYIQILDKANPTNATPAAGALNAIKASVSGGEWLCQIKPEVPEVESAFTAEGPKIIKVTAVDGVGLTTLVSDEFMFDTAKPKITLKKYNLYGEFNDASKAKNVDSTIVVGKTFRINGTLVEKYGLDASAGFKIKQEWKNFAETSTSEKTIDMPAVDASGNWAITLPFNGTDGSAYDNDTIVNNHSADGIYTYTITAKDKAGKTDNDGITFTAKLKTDGPLLEISSPEFDSSNVTKYWQKNRDIMFSGKASSPATVSAIYWTQDESKTTDSWTGWEKAEGTDYWNFTVSVAADGDNHKVFIAAVDSLGNKTSKLEYTIKVDSTGPEVAPKFYQIGSDVIQAVNGSSIYVSGLNPQKLTVYGKYNETVSGPYVPKTGDTLKPLAFQIDGADKTPTIKYSNTDISSLTADELSSDAVKNSFSATSPSLATNSWKAEFTTSDIERAGSFAVTARNGANVPKENTDLSIVIDSKKPEFGNSISITKSSYDRTEDQSDNNSENDVLYYYVNNRDKTTISGTASDANLLSVKIKAESTGKTTINKSETSNPYNWSFELDMTGWTSDTDVTLTVTDKAGNTATKLLKLVFDTTPPLAKHEWDKKDKDLIFRIGEANNELKELKAQTPPINSLDDDLDKNVGGKYLNGTYGNSETIRIRGDFEETGSGLSAIYYKTFDSIPSEDEVKEFIAKPDTEKTGSAISPKVVTQRVSWTDPADDKKKFKEVRTSYSTLISDLKANSANYIVIVAVDKVGNVGLDYAEQNNYEATRNTDAENPGYYNAKKFEDSYYTINIDTVLPDNQLDDNIDATGFINPTLSDDIILSGIASSGKLAGALPAKSSEIYVELQVNEKNIVTAKHDDYNDYKDNGLVTLEKDSPYAKNNVHWTATIKPSEVFKNKTTGAYPVSVIVTDAAGNKQSFPVATINVDTTKPKVNINTIADADKDSTDKLDVNGKLTIDGTASDTEKLSSVKIEYKKEGDSNWTELTQLSGSTPNNWKTEFNTTTLDNADYDIRVTATDAAGNTETDTKTVYVNQDSDRPVVRFSNLTKDDEENFILKYGKNASLEGTITDDDATSAAVVKVFKASSSPITSETGTVSGTTTFNKATGDYTFTPADPADGSKTVYFYMEDNNGKKFYTTHTTELNQPYQLYKTDTKTTTAQDGTVTSNNHAGMISYKSDSEAPDIGTVRLQAYSDSQGNTENGSATNLGESCVVGGRTKNYIKIIVPATDNNGIKNIVLTVNGTEYSSDVTADGVKETDSAGNITFTTKLINISSLITEGNKGNINVTGKVYDKSGLYTNYSSQFEIDREAPSINISTPQVDGALYYGTIEQNVAGSVISGGDINKVYFKVSEDSTLTNFTDGIDITSSVTSMASVVFDGNAGTSNGYHTKTLHDWIKDLRAVTDPSYDIETNDTNVPLYIYYKAVDNCGNFKVEKRLLNVIPNGDKPLVEITYPTNKDDGDGNYTITPALAGTIRLNGKTQLKAYGLDTVSVYVQIAHKNPSTNVYDWDNWESALPEKQNGSPYYTVETIPFGNGLRGIKTDGTADNWNLLINGNKEFDPSGNDISHMAIRVYAVHQRTDMSGNPFGKVSDPEIQLFDIDPHAPHIGGADKEENGRMRYSMQLVQFSSGHEGDFNYITNRAAYKSEMWVTGTWYLIASIYDDQGINSIKLSTPATTELIGSTEVKTTDSGTAASNYDICVPLPTGTANTSGSINWTIEATEQSTNNFSSKEMIRINYDNTPPKISTKDYILDSEKMFMNPSVYDEDGFYNLKGFVSDDDSNASGIFGVAFYFVRRGSKNCVYDPMYYRKNHVSIEGAKALGAEGIANNDIVYAKGLYWKHKTLQTRSDNLDVIELSVADVNIHKGGLVMLGGKIYKIKDISNGKVITLNDTVPQTITTAEFAMAMLVDNRNGESQRVADQDLTNNANYGYGYCVPTDDDGDRMCEKLGSDSAGRWEASIYSKNIPDGPIEIHYIAFDKAQNYTVGIIGNITETAYKALSTKDAEEAVKLSTSASTTDNLSSYYQYYYDADKPAKISNNAPRIASVTVGTDYDSSGVIEDSEKETEYVAKTVEVRGKKKTREVKDKVDISKIFTIKAKAEVGFEIIGGNGNLYYRYKIGESDWQKDANNASMTVHQYSEVVNGETISEGKALDEESGASYFNASTLDPIQISLETINTLVTENTTLTSPSLWTIELWDSTEDSEVFKTSQYAQVNLKCNVQTRDNEEPNTVISPLYWKSGIDNSVYTDPQTDKLKGHVELKDYLGSNSWTAYGKTDDKVSGIIVFRGYAWDNKLLKQLDWAIVNSSGKSIMPNATSGITYNKGAAFANGSWTPYGSLSSDHWAFSVKTVKTTTFNTDGTEAYIDKKGHKVAWELVVDTSYINGITAKDAKLYVCATDAADKKTLMTAQGTPAASVTDQEAKDRGTKKPTYQVDIVPYITGIKSRLDDNRSSNGVYQLAVGETGVELKGYNLAEGNANKAITTPTASTTNYSIEINGCQTINNFNDNSAHGEIEDATEAAKVKNKYNFQPATYNNSLTDDVAIQLWQFNSKAAQTNTGVGFIREPAMAFNTTNGNLGFAFTNGANKFSMANGTTSSYAFWEYNYAKYTANALTFDDSGRSHGISVGMDTEPSIGKAGRMNYFYSSWGTSRTEGSDGNFSNNTNSLHIDTIGIPNANNYKSTDATTSGDWTTTVIVEERFKSTSMVAANHGTNNNPTVYIAYYDDILERIVFRWGTITNNNNPEKENYTNNWGGTDTRNNPNGYDNLITTRETEHSFPLPDGKYSLIAGGSSVPDANGNITALTPYNAGEYVDLALKKGTTTADDVVCVVWYDAKLGNLMYSYKINPCNQNFASTTYTSGHWAQAKVLKQNCGEYCKIAVDANGGVHIAAYDNGNKGVGYVYLPSYDAAYSEETNYYIIDAMNGPFDELGLDVAVDAVGSTGKAYPTISYYANGTPKMATYTAGILKSTGKPAKSWENDSFTGNWDVCFVPTPSKLLKDHINVVQPKKTTGVRSAYGDATAASTGFTFDGTGATDSGKACGNGTVNPIIGYAIRNGSIGYLEIAQRK